jgi:hypothetical protein
MFDDLIHLWARYIGEIGAWHGRSNYPRDEHGVAMPLYGDASVKAVVTDSNVTPFRTQMEGVRNG